MEYFGDLKEKENENPDRDGTNLKPSELDSSARVELPEQSEVPTAELDSRERVRRKPSAKEEYAGWL